MKYFHINVFSMEREGILHGKFLQCSHDVFGIERFVKKLEKWQVKLFSCSYKYFWLLIHSCIPSGFCFLFPLRKMHLWFLGKLLSTLTVSPTNGSHVARCFATQFFQVGKWHKCIHSNWGTSVHLLLNYVQVLLLMHRLWA